MTDYMLGEFVCLNGKFIKNEEAKISIGSLEFSYGFGVYENIRLRNGRVYFLSEHLERLLHSAKMIGLIHQFFVETIVQWVNDTIVKNEVKSANIKMLLIGGQEPQLYIMLLAPQYPDKKIYRDGVLVNTYQFERFLPQAKTLNMLPSYLAYSAAKKVGAYDSLFIDKKGKVAEGTRSNFFVIKNKTLYTPSVEKVLDGVTRRTVIDCAKQNGYKVAEKEIKLKDIFKYAGAFLTNTSGKIIPVRGIMNYELGIKNFDGICDELKNLIKLYDEYLDNL